MDEETIGQRAKKNRNCQCPTCKEWFFSRKSRHTHQMQAHRKLRAEHVPKHSGRRLKPAKELYDAPSQGIV